MDRLPLQSRDCAVIGPAGAKAPTLFERHWLEFLQIEKLFVDKVQDGSSHMF